MSLWPRMCFIGVLVTGVRVRGGWEATAGQRMGSSARAWVEGTGTRGKSGLPAVWKVLIQSHQDCQTTCNMLSESCEIHSCAGAKVRGLPRTEKRESQEEKRVKDAERRLALWVTRASKGQATAGRRDEACGLRQAGGALSCREGCRDPSGPPTHLGSEALRPRGRRGLVQAVVRPPARVPRRQQQVSRPPGAGVVLAQRGRRLREQVLALQRGEE